MMYSGVFQRLGPRSGGGYSSSSQPPHKAAVAKTTNQGKEVCRYWVQGKCKYGVKCRFLHPSTSPCFSSVAQLEGHQNAVTGIALASDKIYTGSKDKSVKAWECNSSQCTGTLNLDGEIGCMISSGPWIFVGLPNLVKAWNFEVNCEMNLVGPVGQVYALATAGDLLCAGVQDGSILVWRFNVETNAFEPAASLVGHTSSVATLAAGPNKLLYSGSIDKTIKIWNLEKRGNVECEQTVRGHCNEVMSVMSMVFSDHNFLVSCSLDGTVKVWLAGPDGSFQVHHTEKVGHGVLTLCGMNDLEGKPVLLCSCNDDTVRVYDVPSFSERGKIYAKKEVRSIQVGSGGMFFTGDGAGLVQVWKWSTPADK